MILGNSATVIQIFKEHVACLSVGRCMETGVIGLPRIGLSAICEPIKDGREQDRR